MKHSLCVRLQSWMQENSESLWPSLVEAILTCYSQKSTDVKNKNNMATFHFSRFNFKVLVLCLLDDCCVAVMALLGLS